MLLVRRIRRARRRAPEEYGQAVARITLTAILWAYVVVGGAFFFDDSELIANLIAIGSVPTATNSALFAWLLIHPETSRLRRVITITSDVVTLSLALIVGGKPSSPFLVIYLWIIFGNGFRFGNAYMLLSAVMSVLSFAIVAAVNPYWRNHIFDALGILLSMVVLPIFARALITRLQEAIMQAEAANAAKGKFIAMMSHELRTPLNAVLGLTDIMSGTKLDTDQRRMLAAMRSSGATLLDLVDDVLEYSRVEAGDIETKPAEFDLIKLLASISAMMEPLATSRNLRFNMHVAPDVPRRLHCDRSHLQKVLINLIGNAIKYTDEGEVIVSIDCCEDGGWSARVRDTGVGIAEDDVAHIFDRFTRVGEADKNTRGGAGLGLAICRDLVQFLDGEITVDSKVGVGSEFCVSFKPEMVVPSDEPQVDLTARKIVLLAREPLAQLVTEALEPSGAKIKKVEMVNDLVESFMEGDGDRPLLLMEPRDVWMRELRAFVCISGGAVLVAHLVTLADDEVEIKQNCIVFSRSHASPENVAQELPRALDIIERLEGGRADLWDGDAKRGRATRELEILVAEDNDLNRQIAARMLQELGHKPTLVSDGEEAIEMMSQASFDLVLMDVNMPILDGVEATKMHRVAERGRQRTPIVALTADVTRAQRHACLEVGMDDVIHKPVSMSSLRSAIERNVWIDGDREEEGIATLRGSSEEIGVLHSAAAVPKSIPALDAARITELDELNADGVFLEKLAQAFLSDASETLNEISESLRDNDLPRLQKARHALRSSALNIGASRVTEVCLEAQTITASTLAERGGQFAEDVKHELAAVRQELSSRLRRPV